MRPAHVASSVRVCRRWDQRNNRHAATALARSLPPDPALNRCSRRWDTIIRIIRSGEITPRREPESGIKEESVVIDYHDPEVPPPKVTIMKFLTMQVYRFR